MLEVFVKSNSHIPIVSMYKHQINKTLEACKYNGGLCFDN